MFISRFASRIRQLEAERAKDNRREIATALNQGQITKRDLIRWGILTTGGTIALKNGLSPFAKSAYAQVPTGTPRTNLRGAQKFSQPLPRPYLPERYKMFPTTMPDNPFANPGEQAYAFVDPTTNRAIDALPAMRTSHHSLYNFYKDRDPSKAAKYRNPVTGQGPIEGRPPIHESGKDYFAHQRWGEFSPKVGYILSMGQIEPGHNVHGNLAPQEGNSVWSCGVRVGHENTGSPPPAGSTSANDPTIFKGDGYYGRRTGYPNPPLILARYDEPVILRIHNDLPVERHLNGGFGRNELSIHTHNAHNAAESDGATNAFHFPGTFYDYHWPTILARHDASTRSGSFMDSLRQKMRAAGFNDADPRTSTVDDNGNRRAIAGDFREIQSSMWFHDHRFFFTAENVQKGIYGLLNMYSGPDNGNETATYRGALRLPSGSEKPWGNLDYDLNLMITNPALDRNDQLTFDIFDTDGYLGDLLCVNGAYCPTTEVKARRYRLRLLNASMARFLQIAAVDQDGNPVQFHCIANDGNLLPRPIRMTSGTLSPQGPAERFDVVIDFGALKRAGVRKVYLVNLLWHKDGRGPEGRVSIASALRGVASDPAVGSFLEFVIGADVANDPSADFSLPEWQPGGGLALTRQIPIVAPTRERAFYFGRADVTARGPDGECTPDCGEAEKFPWAVSVNGQAFHAFNATRISALIPAMGDVEHWRLVNNGGGWDHPVHLHFEEGVTMNRADDPVPATERLARKDVWRLGKGGEVKIQVRFSEFAGAYVQHCHNTIHEDWSMIMRMQLLGYVNGQPQYEVTPTPMPSPTGVTWAASTILDEAQPGFPHQNEPPED